MIYDDPLIRPSGERAIRITFGDERSLPVNRPVRSLARLLTADGPPWLLEMIPTYASLTAIYDPTQISYATLAEQMLPWARRALAPAAAEQPSRLLTVPVCYQEPHAPDMDYICSHCSLTPEEVVAIHTAEPYHVFQLGFTPGCPFIGPLQESLHVPLMESPRTDTPAGAVAISVGQSVIYPRATPGGMRIVGRTPVQLFQVDHPDLTLFKPGDRVSFRAISPQEFDALAPQCKTLLAGVEVKAHGD